MGTSCVTLLLTILLLSSPVMARIAPGEGGSCPQGLKLDTQSGKCLPPGESRPPLGAPSDPTSNPVKSPAATPATTSSPATPPISPTPVQPPKPLPKQAGDDEAQEACVPYPGTVARPLAGGYVCVPNK